MHQYSEFKQLVLLQITYSDKMIVLKKHIQHVLRHSLNYIRTFVQMHNAQIKNAQIMHCNKLRQRDISHCIT